MQLFYINFVSVCRTGVSSSLTQTVDITTQPYATVPFYYFMLAGTVVFFLFMSWTKQRTFIKQQLRFRLLNSIKQKFKQTKDLKNEGQKHLRWKLWFNQIYKYFWTNLRKFMMESKAYFRELNCLLKNFKTNNKRLLHKNIAFLWSKAQPFISMDKYPTFVDLYITYSNSYWLWCDTNLFILQKLKQGILQSSWLSGSFLIDLMLYIWCLYSNESYIRYWLYLLLVKYFIGVFLTFKNCTPNHPIFCVYTYLSVATWLAYNLNILFSEWNPYCFVLTGSYFKYPKIFSNWKIVMFLQLFFTIPLITVWTYITFKVSYPTILLYWAAKFIQFWLVYPLKVICKLFWKEVQSYRYKVLYGFLIFTLNWWTFELSFYRLTQVIVFLYGLYWFITTLVSVKYNCSEFLERKLHGLLDKYVQTLTGRKICLCANIIPYSNCKIKLPKVASHWYNRSTLILQAGKNNQIIAPHILRPWVENFIELDSKRHIILRFNKSIHTFSRQNYSVRGSYSMTVSDQMQLNLKPGVQNVNFPENDLAISGWDINEKVLINLVSYNYTFNNYILSIGLGLPQGTNNIFSDELNNELGAFCLEFKISDQESLIAHITKHYRESELILTNIRFLNDEYSNVSLTKSIKALLTNYGTDL